MGTLKRTKDRIRSEFSRPKQRAGGWVIYHQGRMSPVMESNDDAWTWRANRIQALCDAAEDSDFEQEKQRMHNCRGTYPYG